jgi:hypothetical protein
VAVVVVLFVGLHRGRARAARRVPALCASADMVRLSLQHRAGFNLLEVPMTTEKIEPLTWEDAAMLEQTMRWLRADWPGAAA